MLLSAKNEKLPEKIKEVIYNCIGLNKVYKLNINVIANNHYSEMRNYLNNDARNKTITKLFGWHSSVLDKDEYAILQWHIDFITDALNHSNLWQNFILDWFDSKSHEDEFWKKAILNHSQNLVAILNWYINNNRKMKNSAHISSCIIDNQELFFMTKEKAKVICKFMEILPNNSYGRISRGVSLNLINEQFPNNKKQALVENFGSCISLPDFDSKASKGMIIHFIESANSQEIVDWLNKEMKKLQSITWGDQLSELSQAIRNISDQFDIGKLKELIVSNQEENETREEIADT